MGVRTGREPSDSEDLAVGERSVTHGPPPPTIMASGQDANYLICRICTRAAVVRAVDRLRTMRCCSGDRREDVPSEMANHA